MTATSEVEVAKKYGNFHKPKGFGIGPFGTLGTGLLVALAFIVILAIPLFGIITAVVVGMLGMLVLMSMVWKDRYDQSILDRLQDRRGYAADVRANVLEYLPGTLTYIGSHRLPGVLADSKLHIWTDKDGEEFTILEYPGTKGYVVNIGAESDGASLIDPDELTAMVMIYGDWISDLAHESEDLLQAAVCIETSQGTGPGLKLELSSNASETASSLSKEWASQVTKTYPKGTTSIRSYITLSFRAPKPDLDLNGKKIKGQSPLEAIARMVADRLPSLLESLPETGAGEVHALTYSELVEAALCAYNPDRREIYDECAAQGIEPPVVLWDNAGPNGSVKRWNYYQHGTEHASVTYEAAKFISTSVTSKVLMPLLEPTDGVIKRMTWLYKPVPPELSGVMAERDHHAADGRVKNAKKPTARQKRTASEAETVRNHEADGNALVNFAILFTATVLLKDLNLARSVVKRQGPRARMLLREQNGCQDSSFAQACGFFGLVTSSHLSTPTTFLSGV
jgi:hypothetical protein